MNLDTWLEKAAAASPSRLEQVRAENAARVAAVEATLAALRRAQAEAPTREMRGEVGLMIERLGKRFRAVHCPNCESAFIPSRGTQLFCCGYCQRASFQRLKRRGRGKAGD